MRGTAVANSWNAGKGHRRYGHLFRWTRRFWRHHNLHSAQSAIPDIHVDEKAVYDWPFEEEVTIECESTEGKGERLGTDQPQYVERKSEV